MFSASQIVWSSIALVIVLPGLLYLCVKAVQRARNEEKISYLKQLKGDLHGQERQKG